MSDLPGVDRGASAADRAAGALLFMNSGLYTLDAYSTLNSSPWTAENFGGDPDKAKTCREYVRHAIVYSSIYSLASAWISGSYWPIVGSAANNVYLYYLYDRALKRGRASGSVAWGTSSDGVKGSTSSILHWNNAR